ncbi:hypothetical protein M0638_09000 [Roseomonas sp. NAR14]|uniref:Uncharacterized protein n=1 Tax=Roseomonas acroporae TaxID=2937791 RepID=A0A9X1YDG0_9PROT|nr:hypothetical protein [Roseomonas acroporae]MCK8784516.1 hypothetical protein [Roseomonas acroporae]
MPTLPLPPVPPADRSANPPGGLGDGDPQDTHAEPGLRPEDSPLQGDDQDHAIRRNITERGYRPHGA